MNIITAKQVFTMGGDKEKALTNTVEDVLTRVLAIPPVVARGSMMDHLVKIEGVGSEAKIVWDEEILRGIGSTDEFHLRQIKTYMEKRLEETKKTF